ncbi:hypothetical protein [Capnocytophaga sp. oral taxon 878]|uniref:hypothetical protein n=1 Tax=Capnocytophaga sp. oral taxon 878 TaxID=1316596 RepID=UPI000D0397FC|nr:hypothetical protein [Capnocytophaga sp. oral taxon 878]AVM49312.1 hypothetical protein C4H12_01835 [Capnocytophaga sp. oral taxon 878]
MSKQQPKLSGAASIIARSAVENNKTAVTTTINIGFILLGVSVLAIGGTAFYYLFWKNRFVKAKYNGNMPRSNVSPAAAQAKAEALYQAMKGAGTNEEAIKRALAGVNYNGYIAIYNAFGKREPGGLTFSLGNGNYEDLTSFLHGDLSESELAAVRRIMAPGAGDLI